MAFSNAPETQTYSSQRVPLVNKPFSTSVNSWSVMENVLPVKLGDEYIAETRPAISAAKMGFNTTPGEVCRGVHVWEKTASTVLYFVVSGYRVYKASNSLINSWSVVASFTDINLTTSVRFCEFIKSDGTKYVIFTDGKECFFWDGLGGPATKITSANIPTPHLAFPIFLNGRLYLAKINTGDIYCSNLDNAATWTAGDFISSEVYPDDIQAIVKINNYILAIGLTGCEYFYDAANATGSPLARQEGAILPFGTIAAGSIATTSDSVCFLSRDKAGEFCIRFIEGFNHKEAPAPFLIQEINSASASTSGGTFKGYFFRHNGLLYYGLLDKGVTNLVSYISGGFTYVYAFDAGMWVRFTRGRDHFSTTDPRTGQTYEGIGSLSKPLPIQYACTGSLNDAVTIVAGSVNNWTYVGTLEAEASGDDYIPYTDETLRYCPYLSTVYTPAQDFGTMNLKTMHRVGVDYVNSKDGTTLPVGSDATYYIPRVSYWDSTVSTYWQKSTRVLPYAYSLNTSSTPGLQLNFPFLTQLGAFRRRWLQVSSYGALQYRYLEIDINKGQQ